MELLTLIVYYLKKQYELKAFGFVHIHVKTR